MSHGAPYALLNDGVRLAVRLTPRASRSGIGGIVHDAEGRSLLAIRLNAPPVDGAANKALIAFLADALDLRRADIAIRSGETSRTKILQLGGDGVTLARRIDAWIGNSRRKTGYGREFPSDTG